MPIQRPFISCVCSDRQLAEVGCDCGFERDRIAGLDNAKASQASQASQVAQAWSLADLLS